MWYWIIKSISGVDQPPGTLINVIPGTWRNEKKLVDQGYIRAATPEEVREHQRRASKDHDAAEEKIEKPTKVKGTEPKPKRERKHGPYFCAIEKKLNDDPNWTPTLARRKKLMQANPALQNTETIRRNFYRYQACQAEKVRPLRFLGHLPRSDNP